jgi:hypothetical protein
MNPIQRFVPPDDDQRSSVAYDAAVADCIAALDGFLAEEPDLGGNHAFWDGVEAAKQRILNLRTTPAKDK